MHIERFPRPPTWPPVAAALSGCINRSLLTPAGLHHCRRALIADHFSSASIEMGAAPLTTMTLACRRSRGRSVLAWGLLVDITVSLERPGTVSYCFTTAALNASRGDPGSGRSTSLVERRKGSRFGSFRLFVSEFVTARCFFVVLCQAAASGGIEKAQIALRKGVILIGGEFK
jgi:hypothetical protein